MPALVAVRPIVAVGHAVDVEAHGLTAVRDGVDPLALDGGRRADAGPGPVEVGIAFELGHHELPEQAPVLLVQAQEHAAVALVARVAGAVVVRADVHPAARNDGRRVRLRAQGHRPLGLSS